MLEVGGAIGLFHPTRSLGGGNVAGYLVGSAAPVVGALVVWARSRKFSGASAEIFASTALSAAVAVVGSTDPRVLLYEDCATTALVGLVFALSCVLMPRPVMFYFAQRYGTDGTRTGMGVFAIMWTAYPGSRRSMCLISIVWAAIFLVQAGGHSAAPRVDQLRHRLRLGPDPAHRGVRGGDDPRAGHQPTGRTGRARRPSMDEQAGT